MAQRDFDALHLQGVNSCRAGRVEEGIALLRKAVTIQPRSAEAYFNLGNALHATQRLDQALAAFTRAVAIRADFVPALFNRGVVLAALGQHARARDSFVDVLGLVPDHPGALLNGGNANTALGQHAQALALFQRACVIAPTNAEAHYNCGNSLAALGRHAEAVARYERAIALRADFSDALFNKGNALVALGDPMEALCVYDRLLATRPDHAAGWCQRGAALLTLNRTAEALDSCERSLGFERNCVATWINRGNALQALGRFDAAQSSYDQALGVDPASPQALSNRAHLLSCIGSYEEAARAFEELRRVSPDLKHAAGGLFYSRIAACDWAGYHAQVPSLEQAILARQPAAPGLVLLAATDKAEVQLRGAQLQAGDYRYTAAEALNRGERYGHRRVRVAYVSADFRDHALTYLMAGVFERHDRGRFETIALTLRPLQDNPTGRRLQAAFDRVIDASTLSDREAASGLRGLEVDIAVDLTGYTDGMRPAILGYRPAPVQINYLGYPGTLGAPWIDYLIADEFVIPRQAGAYYSERIIRLPDCFQANDDRRAASGPPPTRSAAGLPEAGIVLCSFNNPHKLNPDFFAVWMRLLRAHPESVLWLIAGTPALQDNIRREALARGIAAERIVFAPALPYADHLARLPLADLFLDSLPFNAGATASDALWSGVPVLTCTGEALASRMAGSLLNTLNLPELITTSRDDYEAVGHRLLGDPAALGAIRARLASARATSPLFDTERFCRRLELAYTLVCERAEQRLPPQDVDVPRA